MTRKRYFKEDFHDEYAIKKEDIIIAVVDSGSTVNKICDELNALHEENKKLRTLNYVNKEAVRLNNIKTVQIGKEDVDCTNINWKLLYELYNSMIDFYYDESGDLE